MYDEFMPPEDPKLVRLELMGNLARAARLVLQECERADQVVMSIDANAHGMSVDVQLFDNGVAFSGWGV